MRTVLLVVAVALTLFGCATSDVGMPTDEPSPTDDADMPADDPPSPPHSGNDEGAAEDSAGHTVITTEDDGGHLRFDLSSRAELRLDGEALWDEPVVEGEAIELAAIQYFQDPGYQAWEIMFHRAGTATIHATTAPDSAQEQRTFDVTIEVTGN